MSDRYIIRPTFAMLEKDEKGNVWVTLCPDTHDGKKAGNLTFSILRSNVEDVIILLREARTPEDQAFFRAEQLRAILEEQASPFTEDLDFTECYDGKPKLKRGWRWLDPILQEGGPVRIK